VVLKHGVYVVQSWFGNVWSSLSGQQQQQQHRNGEATQPRPTSNSGSYLSHMDAPPDNDCCSVCHDSFNLPCQANCAHWFCGILSFPCYWPLSILTCMLYLAGECILRVWQHSSVLQPCKCPICRRSITLLIPSEVSDSQQQEPEVEGIMQDLAKYNRIFGGGPVSFLQASPFLSSVLTQHCLSVCAKVVELGLKFIVVLDCL
jgi:hypothetical protein